MKATLAAAYALIAVANLGGSLTGCGSAYDRDCIRRHATLPREQRCLGERTQDNDEHEPFEPAAPGQRATSRRLGQDPLRFDQSNFPFPRACPAGPRLCAG